MAFLPHPTFAPNPNRCRAQPPNTENRMFGGVGGAGNQPCLHPIVAEFVILHLVAGCRMIKSVLDRLLCSGYFLLFRLRMHSHAGAWERACHMGVLVVASFWIPACAGMTRENRNDEVFCDTLLPLYHKHLLT